MPKKPAKSDLPPARPPQNVPATAEWIAEWKQWGDGARQDGKRTGPWTFWRGDGSLQEESRFVDDKLDGEAVRYHPDGRLAAKQRWSQGALIDNHLFFIDGQTDEFKIDLHESIRSCRALHDDDGKWLTSIQFFDGQGARLTLGGAPAPAFPAGLPEHAYLNDEATAFRVGRFLDGKHLGIHQTWSLEGETISVVYTNESHYGRVSKVPGEASRSHPLVAATAAGDRAAVEELFALGLGREPGAALQAALAGQRELALRLAALPPGPALIELPSPPRPEGVSEDARYVPGLDRWVRGEVDPTRGISAEVRVWKVYDGEVFHVEISRFEDGVLRERRTHYGASEADKLTEEELFDERGQQVRRRKIDDYSDAFEDEETLPGGRQVKRHGVKARVLSEQHLDEDDALVRTLGFDAEGRTRADFDVKAKRGKIFDEAGALLGSGPVDEGGDAKGTWLLADGRKVATGGLGLEAEASTAELLPLLARLAKEPMPAALRPSVQVPWKKLEGFFPMNQAEIPNLLRMVALDEPAAANFALGAMADAILHQDTISELTGPVMRLVVGLLGQLRHPGVLAVVLDLLADMLYRGRNLDAAHEIKKAYSARKGSSAKELAKAMRRAHQEESYGEIVHALQAQRAVLEGLTGHANKKLARLAVLVLAFVEGKEAAAALGALLERPHERGPKVAPAATSAEEKARRGQGDEDGDDGEDDDGDGDGASLTPLADTAAFALSLYPRDQLPLPELRGAVALGEPQVRLEAALTLVRTAAEDERAIEVVLQALRDGDEDAGVVMTLLPDAAQHLSSLVALLREASMVDIYGLARAALALALVDDDDSDDDDDDSDDDDDDDSDDDDSDDDDSDDEVPEVPQPLRDVLEALVASDDFWRLNSNASAVLDDFGLPGSRAVLSALLRGEPPPEEAGEQIFSSASGMAGASVDSWRDLRRS